MTIKHSLTRRILITMIGAVSLFPAFLTGNQFKPPWVTSFSYSYPSFGVLDDADSVYTIDQSLKRITKVNRAGDLVFELLGNDRGDGGFFYANELVVDKRGRLYLLNTVPQREGFYTEKEEVLVYEPNGKLLRRIYSRIYSSSEITNHNITRSRMLGLHLSGDQIVWYELADEGVIESRIDTGNWRLQQESVLQIPKSARQVASVARLSKQSIAYSLKNGNIYLKRDQQQPVLLYSGDAVVADGLSIPWWLGRIDDDHLLFTDIARSSFVRLSLSRQAKTIVNAAQISAFTGDDYPYIYYGFGRSKEGVFSTVNDIGVVAFESTGKLLSFTTGGRFSAVQMAIIVFFWFGFLLIVLGAGLLVQWAYRDVFQRKINLAYKQLFVFLPLIIGVMLSIALFGLERFNRRIHQRTEEQLSQLAQVVAGNLDYRALDRLSRQQDINSDDYELLRSKLHRSLNHNKDPWNRHLYFALHRIYRDEIYTMMYLNDGVGMFHPFTYLNDAQGIYWQVARSGIKTIQTSDPWGSWLLAVAPIKNAENKTVALIEVGRDMYSYQQEVQRNLRGVYVIAILSAGAMIVAFVFITWLFLSPLRQLKVSVDKVREGNWESDIKIRGHDEVAELSVAFNAMIGSIRGYIQQLVDVSTGYQRFVPEQFLSQLNRANVTEIKLGDQVQMDMTILFTDIRAFTQISEQMSPKENFDFLNRYLGMVGPLVRKNNGFIDKYIGDAIMALYPSRSEDAILTAIQIQQTLELFNHNHIQQNVPAITIGVGIHTGSLMLGILGEPERFDGSVISDNVNLASRIEGLTKFFETAILVSDATMSCLGNKGKFMSRYLGQVKVMGKKEPFGIYEILDSLPMEDRIRKAAAIPALEAGIAAYQKGDLVEAERSFEKVLEAYEADVPAQIYLGLVKAMQGQDLPADWTGAIVMHGK